MPRGQTIKMFYEQQEKQKQLLKVSPSVAPAPSYEVSITTSDALLPSSLMTQFIQPQLMSPPPNNSVSASGIASGIASGGGSGSGNDVEEFAGQTVTYVPLHQVASTFSEIVDVAGEQKGRLSRFT